MAGSVARPSRRHYFLAALAWMSFAIYGSLVPLQFRRIPVEHAVELFKNLPPLWFGMGTRADWVANILLFIPLTFLWMATLTCDRGRVVRLITAVVIPPLALLLAMAIEFTQFYFPGRTTSRNDIVAETIGGIIGVLLWLTFGGRVTRWLRSQAKERNPRSKLIWLLEAYLVGFALWSVIPLDLSLSVTDLYRKYRIGQIVLVPFLYSYDSVADAIFQFSADFMVFVPIGAWAALTERRWFPATSRLVRGTVIGGGIAAAIELAQLLVLSRFSDATDVVIGTIGAAFGAWFVHRSVRSTTTPTSAQAGNRLSRFAWPGLAILVYSALLLVRFWYPFDFTRDRAVAEARLDKAFRVPLFALYQGTEFNAIQQVLVRLLLFAALGAMWAWLASLASGPAIRRVIWLTGAAYAAAMAVGIELGQVLLPSRTADATEVLICFVGSLIGLWVTPALLPAVRTRGREDQPRS